MHFCDPSCFHKRAATVHCSIDKARAQMDEEWPQGNRNGIKNSDMSDCIPKLFFITEKEVLEIIQE